MGVAVSHKAHKGDRGDGVVNALHQNIKGVRTQIGQKKQCNTQMGNAQTNQQNNQSFDEFYHKCTSDITDRWRVLLFALAF